MCTWLQHLQHTSEFAVASYLSKVDDFNLPLAFVSLVVVTQNFAKILGIRKPETQARAVEQGDAWGAIVWRCLRDPMWQTDGQTDRHETTTYSAHVGGSLSWPTWVQTLRILALTISVICHCSSNIVQFFNTHGDIEMILLYIQFSSRATIHRRYHSCHW